MYLYLLVTHMGKCSLTYICRLNSLVINMHPQQNVHNHVFSTDWTGKYVNRLDTMCTFNRPYISTYTPSAVQYLNLLLARQLSPSSIHVKGSKTILVRQLSPSAVQYLDLLLARPDPYQTGHICVPQWARLRFSIGSCQAP